jgi:predicted alpha/beta-fold hydrolase
MLPTMKGLQYLEHAKTNTKLNAKVPVCSPTDLSFSSYKQSCNPLHVVRDALTRT